ncbi:recombinase family protein [uncultured Clostridium sp.]|uniref:recombinase family protein n=1 Tax=uncultured Clostridium sp. TaxID=59620 RepID=UPI0028EDA169|nr:recombinase family protein [uncultured Clostridium sp.]
MIIAAYMRKSVKGDENSISIEAQLETIKSYFIKEENCEFVTYIDDGFSGGNTNRPAFQKLMDDAHYNKFDCVACYKLDRMARNTLDFLTTFEEFKKINVDLVCVQDNYDPRTPAGKMMMTLLASLAEMERENIKRRAIDGMYNLAKQGRWSGGTPPYGCSVVEDVGGKYLRIDKKEELLYMFNKFSKGVSMYQLSKEIGITARNMTTVLRNPLYLISDEVSSRYLSSIGYKVIGEPNGNGYMTYKHNKNSKNKKDKLIELAVVSKNKGIIPSNLWISVREKIKDLQHTPPRKSKYSWLAHKIICKQCGKILNPHFGSIRKDGTRPMYFHCRNKCYSAIRLEKVEDDFLNLLKSRNLISILSSNTENNNNSRIASNLKKQMDKKEKMYNGMIEKAAIAPTKVAKDMLEKAELLFEEIEKLNNEYTKYEILLKNKDNKPDILKDKNKAKNEFIKTFYSSTLEEKQSLINIFIERIVWDGVVFEIY